MSSTIVSQAVDIWFNAYKDISETISVNILSLTFNYVTRLIDLFTK